jgi:small subunit ribosomal protein S8
MHSDPIADMLTRIRNAQAVGKRDVLIPYSNLKHGLAKVLSSEGWLGKIEVAQKHKIGKRLSKQERLTARHDQLRVTLSYKEDGQPKISELKRISKPGRRIYVRKGELPTVLNGFGIAIVSTSGGLMTASKARSKGVGGEIICEIN